MEPVLSHVQQDYESIGSGEKLRDNEVNIGLLNTSIVPHKMFAVILWPLFSHIRNDLDVGHWCFGEKRHLLHL